MLVLTRKTGERLQIGDRIVITVAKVEGGRVRLAISAPDDVKVFRQELMARSSALNHEPATV